MKIHTEAVPRAKHIVSLYGPPKSGKTRLAGSLPWGEEWGEKAIYCAWDAGSEALSSIPTHHREHLIVVQPSGSVGPNGEKRYDPLTEAVAMATYDWKGKYPGVNTIIWDTMTETSRQLLFAYADTKVFSDKHITFGTPGTASYHAIPMEGDYGAAQRSTLFILKALFKQDMNVIVLFHDTIVSPDREKGDKFESYGGPAIAGKSGTQAVAGMFDNLLRVEAEPKFDGKTMKPRHVLYSTPKGLWLAGYRNPLTGENPFARVELRPDPVDFWESFASIQRGDNAPSHTQGR